jgi:FdhE protein
MIASLPEGPAGVSNTWSQSKETYPRRLERCKELAARNRWADEVLGFYAAVLQFQQEVYEAGKTPSPVEHPSVANFREAIDLGTALAHIPRLLATVRQSGPGKLGAECASWGNGDNTALRTRLTRWLAAGDVESPGDTFVARVVLEPLAERVAHSRTLVPDGIAGNKCPLCESDPQMAVIRQEGDGGKRMLLCSLCHSEWEFRRILCPACGEENHEKLPRYTAEGIAAVRVEACDTCKVYLKSVDLTVDGHAVPLVDEVATAPLDLWASERGYHKVLPGVMGF